MVGERRVLWLACLPLAAAVGCSFLLPDGGGSTSGTTGENGSIIDEGATPEEKRLSESAKDFYVAIAARKYAAAYDMLSKHATTNVHPHQFVTPENSDTPPSPADKIEQMSKDQFLSLMQQVEDKYGPPKDIEYLSVDETDPAALSGKGDRFSVAMAIGMMPESTPASIRKAALRGQIRCQWKPEDAKKYAEETGTTVEQLDKDDEAHPYYKLMTVLVENEGKLSVGYLEFRGPSILD